MIKRFLLLMLLAFPLFAADDIVSWIGTTDRAIPADAKPVTVPITLASAVTTAPQVRQVTFAGEEIDSGAVQASWSGTELARKLSLTVDAAATKKIGTYTVVIYVATPDAAKFTARTLEVKLNRRGATLSIPAPLRAERITYLGRYAQWYPEAWVISEGSGRDGFTPSAKRWTVTLKPAETAPHGSLVYLDLLPVPPKPKKVAPAKPAAPATPVKPAVPPATATTGKQEKKPATPKPAATPKTVAAAPKSVPPAIPAGGQALLKPTGHTDCCPFGTLSGKFSLNESQLSAPQEISVEVISRLWRGWLFLIIVFFIAVGHIVRKVLEDRRSLNTAQLAAAAVRKDFQALGKTITGDPRFTSRANTVASTFLEEMKSKDAAAVTAAIKKATDEIAAIRTEHATARKDAKDLVQKVRAAIGDVSSIPGSLQKVAAEIDDQLDLVDARLATGRVSGTADEAKAIETTAPARLQLELPQWQAALDELLAEAASWADIDTSVLQTVRTKVQALKSETLEDAAAVFSTARYAHTNVVAQAPRFDSAVTRIATIVAAGLTIDVPALPQDLPRLMAADPHAAATQLRGLRDALKKALRDMVPDGKPVPPEIAESKFEKAVDAVIALQPEDQALGEEEAMASPQALPEPPAQPPAAPPAEIEEDGGFFAEIDIDGEQIVGETLQLTMRVSRDGAPVPHLVVQWWNGPVALQTGVTLSYTLTSTDPVVLTAKTTVDHRQITRTARLAATPDFIFDPDFLRDQIDRVNWIQTAIAGLFITVIGYLLFEKSFVGTLVDLAAAAIWGFASDITLARVLDYAKPLTDKKPTFPGG